MLHKTCPVRVFLGLPACPPATGKFYGYFRPPCLCRLLLPSPTPPWPIFLSGVGSSWLMHAPPPSLLATVSQHQGRRGRMGGVLVMALPLQQPVPLRPPQLVTVVFPKCTSSPGCKTHSFAMSSNESTFPYPSSGLRSVLTHQAGTPTGLCLCL